MTLDTFFGLQMGLSLSSRSFALGCPFSPENSYSARSLKKASIIPTLIWSSGCYQFGFLEGGGRQRCKCLAMTALLQKILYESIKRYFSTEKYLNLTLSYFSVLRSLTKICSVLWINCDGGSVIAGPFSRKRRLGRALYEFEVYTDPAKGTHSPQV